MDDQRRYFRIDDIVIVRVTPLNASEVKLTQQAMRAGAPLPVRSGPPLISIDARIERALDALQTKAPLTHRTVSLLHQKLQSLSMALLERDPNQQEQALLPEEVNVSATGFALYRDPPLAEGQEVLMEWVLFPEQLSLSALGRVVALRANERFNTAIDFTFILPSHGELLIRHVIKKQAQQIKQERRELKESL